MSMRGRDYRVRIIIESVDRATRALKQVEAGIKNAANAARQSTRAFNNLNRSAQVVSKQFLNMAKSAEVVGRITAPIRMSEGAMRKL